MISVVDGRWPTSGVSQWLDGLEPMCRPMSVHLPTMALLRCPCVVVINFHRPSLGSGGLRSEGIGCGEVCKGVVYGLRSGSVVNCEGGEDALLFVDSFQDYCCFLLQEVYTVFE